MLEEGDILAIAKLPGWRKSLIHFVRPQGKMDIFIDGSIYVQDVEKYRPCPPGRCCSALHNAVVACWELAPAEHSPDSSQVYSVSREAAHSSDDV